MSEKPQTYWQPLHDLSDSELLLLSDLMRRAQNGSGVYGLRANPEFQSLQAKIDDAIVVRWRDGPQGRSSR